MKLCMHVEYHDANNVSNIGVDPIMAVAINFVLRCYTYSGYTGTAHHSRDAATDFAAVVTRYAGSLSMEDRRRKCLTLPSNDHTSLCTALVFS